MSDNKPFNTLAPLAERISRMQAIAPHRGVIFQENYD